MFYQKLGNNSFTPNVKVSSILLDNSTLESNNDIEVDIQFSSKQNFVDSFLTDSEYLSYVKLSLMVFDNKQNAINVAKSYANNPSYTNPNDALVGASYTVQTKVISISDYSVTNEVNGNYSGVFESFFRDIDKTNGDIVLLILPYVDFNEFANQNNINTDYIYDALKNIYTNEAHIYTILDNNNVPDSEVINDVRDLTEFKNNLLSLLPISNSINFDILNSNPTKQQYFFNIYPSFDAENQKIKLFSLFNLKQFVNNFSAISKSYNTDAALSVLNQDPIVININKTFLQSDEQETVGSITLKKDGIIQSNVNAQYYTTFGDNMLFSFEDVYPTSTTSIEYSFEVVFTDPILKKYYINDINKACLYNNVIRGFSRIQKIINIDDPRISNAKTGKFEPSFISFTYNSTNIQIINNFVEQFTELLNLFLETKSDITNEQKTKIKNLLDIRKSTIFVFIDLYFYITNILVQIENIFSQIKNSNIVYYKKFDSFEVELLLPMFETTNPLSDIIVEQANPSQASTGKTYFNKLSGASKFSTTLTLNNVKQTDTANYLLKNALVTSINKESSFSITNDLSNYLNESKGLVVKETTTQFETKESNGRTSTFSKKTTSPNKLLNNSFGQAAAVTFNIPLPTTIFGSADNNKILLNANLNQPIEDAKVSNRLKEEFLFNISTNSSDKPEEMIPETELQYLTIENNSLTWKVVTSNLLGTNFVRTAYKKTNNMFSKNNIQPKIANEYRIEISVGVRVQNTTLSATTVTSPALQNIVSNITSNN